MAELTPAQMKATLQWTVNEINGILQNKQLNPIALTAQYDDLKDKLESVQAALESMIEE